MTVIRKKQIDAGSRRESASERTVGGRTGRLRVYRVLVGGEGAGGGHANKDSEKPTPLATCVG
jgi:hypothetical protein